MTDRLSASRCDLPPSPAEDHAFYSDGHQARVAGNGPHTTSRLTPAATRAKWTYFLLGCAILLPFNALFNSTPFFLSRLVGTPFYSTYSSYSSSVYTLTKLVCQFYCTITSKQSSRFHRILASIIGMILLVTCLDISAFIRGTPSTFFAFSLFTAASMAVAAGYLCTAVYAGAALLGTSFLQSVLAGQAAVTVVVSVVQVASSVIALRGSSLTSISEAGGGQAEEIAAQILFGVSAMFLSITLVSFAWLAREPSYGSVTSALEQHRRAGVAGERTRLLADHSRSSSLRPKSDVYRVFRENLIFMFSIAYVFVVTLAIYPAITVRVRPMNPNIHPLLFSAIHFLVMNVGGFIGQYSCSFPRLQIWSGKKILIMSLLRTLFIPLVLLCNVERPASAPPTPPIIHSDVLFMTIALIMGYTTGYVATQTLLAASSLVHNPRLKGRYEDVDVAATLCGSCMIFGLALGSLSSFGVLAMI